MSNAIRTWNPWRKLDQLQNEMGRMFGRNRISQFIESKPYPAVNLSHDNESVTLRAELPGYDPEAINIDVDGNSLTISGERHFEKEESEGNKYPLTERFRGSFKRTITLPFDVNSANAEAVYRDGVLELVLHRPEEHKPKKLEVKRG